MGAELKVGDEVLGTRKGRIGVWIGWEDISHQTPNPKLPCLPLSHRFTQGLKNMFKNPSQY